MKKSLKVCSVLLASILVLFSCSNPTIADTNSSYEVKSVTDYIKVPASYKKSNRLAVNANTPKNTVTTILETLNKESAALQELASEDLNNDPDGKKAFKANQANLEKYNNDLATAPKYTGTYTQTLPTKNFSLPTYDGYFNITQYEQVLESTTDTSNKRINSTTKVDTIYTLQMLLPETTQYLTKSGYEKVNNHSIISFSLDLKNLNNILITPDFSKAPEINSKSEDIVYFDNSTYAGYMKYVSEIKLEGQNIYDALVYATETDPDLVNDLNQYMNGENLSPKLEDVLNTILNTYTLNKINIIFYDMDGKNPYVFQNTSGPLESLDLTKL